MHIFDGNDEKKLLNLVKQPRLEKVTVLPDSTMVMVQMAKKKVHLCKPIFIGAVILNKSKLIMQRFYYDVLMKLYNKDTCRILASDTDSFILHIFTKDFHKDIAPLAKDHFDTSNYPPNHPSGIEAGLNKKKPGYFKDELAGVLGTGFRDLRPKLYVLETEEKCEKRAKGVQKDVVAKKLRFEHYDRCLREQKEFYTRFVTLRPKDHEISTTIQSKIALAAGDDKRWIIPGDPEYRTLAWGDYRIPDDVKAKCKLGPGLKEIVTT